MIRPGGVAKSALKPSAIVGMSINRIAHHGVRHFTQHCGLHHCDHLTPLDTEYRETKNLVTFFGNQGLHKSAGFGQCPCTQISRHRQF
jgi:hypothetical protein